MPFDTIDTPHHYYQIPLDDIWSKLNVSYTEAGINVETNVTSASDLHSLIDAFGKLCDTNPPDPAYSPTTVSGITPLYRNKSHQSKPVNYFICTDKLGKRITPIRQNNGQLRDIADACIHTYFECWIRFTPILSREEFMQWYMSHPDPTSTLIVNAICLFVFRHMVTHHCPPELEHYITNQDTIQEQEEYFFEQAREYLAQTFDHPDRFTIIALSYMMSRAEPSRRHQYAGMAVSALHQLDIYPRLVEDDDTSFEKEKDTRLWWFVWAWDFYMSSSGAPKNTPQPRVPGKEIDLPRVMEQDIDNGELGILAFIHCLQIWKIQSRVVTTFYEQAVDMTLEQLHAYDKQLLEVYQQLPCYLKGQSKNNDVLLASIRVHLEYNATRIILHKLFIPDQNDPRPSQASLESLNVCLKAALQQIPNLSTELPKARCAFDRDEFWRACEVISLAMDIHRTCASPKDRALITKDVDLQEFESGLTRGLHILKNTKEYQVGGRGWIQVVDWLEVQIRRHQLYSRPRPIMDPSCSLENLKREVKQLPSFDHQYSMHSFQATKKSLANTSSISFVPFHPTSSSPPRSRRNSSDQRGKVQSKFRYFSPKKMNKFMFIDDNPIF
ncbi:hypothetical protein BCV72DRAFT_234133 [Rhizopus microsporus var. microsporus]|uniref:Transcription factor domain-containing protein n=1 Tax=Rhizopus microsporus var. microsporus TaxID=86635 RepID=A0A1X0QSS6_RHIZD|nr:hypothetical protein BCV72DRAFT_234133 [Rhizopus microsporus var. microsporus]